MATSAVGDPGRVERRIQGSGLQLAITEYGDAARPTVLLVHGFPDTGTTWGPLVERLAPWFHVVTYDVRGAGHSDAPDGRAGYVLPRLVEDMAAVADAVSPGMPVHLVAHDWGSVQGWEAVTTEGLAGRFASYTTISGPPLDHAALWARRHRTRHVAAMGKALRQAAHSWYIVFFHLPVLPKLVARGDAGRRVWARVMHRMDGVPTDDGWPAPTFGADFANGVELYRANVRQRFVHPTEGHTATPVQIIVPLGDRYVTPALIDGLESWSSTVWRREVDAGHWVIRTHPDDMARWVREVIAYVEGGTEDPDLARCRVTSDTGASSDQAGRVA